MTRSDDFESISSPEARLKTCRTYLTCSRHLLPLGPRLPNSARRNRRPQVSQSQHRRQRTATTFRTPYSALWRWHRHDLDFRSTLALTGQKALMHSIEQLRQLVPKAVEIVHSEMDNENFPAAIAVLRLVHRHLETYEHLAS